MSARALRTASVFVLLSHPTVAQAPAQRVEASEPTPLAPACAEALVDRAGGTCLHGSRTPTLGLLYPLSANLNVNSVTGNVDFANNLTKGGELFINTNGSSSTAIGIGALSNNTGSSNTAAGSRAMSSNTSGSRNTAAGASALFSNTTGNDNTATGFRALISNTSGTRNTATGNDAMQLNRTGSENTAHGSEALLANDSGSCNTAIGARALWANIQGHGNTATGCGALSSNFGDENTASGSEALRSNTFGSSNTATGCRALWMNTTGIENVALGAVTLLDNTTGSGNTAVGFNSMALNTLGTGNAGLGRGSLNLNTTGSDNTAAGSLALFLNDTGSRNAALGFEAGLNNDGDDNVFVGYRSGCALQAGSDNVLIGSAGVAGDNGTIRVGDTDQSRAFFAGIRGVTTANADAIPVVIDSAGQLGTISSSRRFKEDIHDMGDASGRLRALRPVCFRYKEGIRSGERNQEYGLIAEEVAEVFPDLVVYDQGGEPLTVKYHLLSSMLLNELQKLGDRFEQQEESHAAELAELGARLDELEARVQGAEADSTPRRSGRAQVASTASR